jgi:hypothetical protein
MCYVEESRPPLWSSGQRSQTQIQNSGFDSRHYQIFWEVVGLERGSLSLVSTIGTLYPQKVGTNFAGKQLSPGRYSSLEDSGHGVYSFLRSVI